METWPKINFNFQAEISKLKDQLNESCHREKELDDQIKSTLSENADLPKQLDLIFSRVKSRLAVAESDSKQLDALLNLTSSLADNVSGQVRELDLCKSRVVECLQRVEDALDLRLCTEGVRSAMANEDYEQAASHVHRFLSLDNSVVGLRNLSLLSDDENDQERPAESLEHQFAVMKKATDDLKQILAAKFDEALQCRDVASMERFFKLFPLLGQHELGLKKFGSYLKSQIAEAARKNFAVMLSINTENMENHPDQSRLAVIHSDSLTMLLEGVARIFEVHQPLVETYYGPEYLLTLAEILQEQCDEEASHILDQFVQNRKFNVKYKLIDTHGRSSTFKINEKVDLLELDQVLSEVALLQTRAELYFRFIKRRVANSSQMTAKNFDEKTTNVSKNVPNKEKIFKLEKLVRECRLSCRVQELIGRYIPMEEFYTRETLSKAVELNAGGDDAASLVDDVFFVVRKSVQRASSSSNADCLCAVLNNACALLETDFYHLLQQRLKNGYPAAGSLAEAYTTATAYVSVVQQGKIPAPYGPDSAEKARADFLAALNAVDSTAECVKSLKETLTREIGQNFQQSSLSGDDFLTQEKRQMTAKVDNCCSQLVDLAAKFENLALSASDQLMNAAAKQRLKLIAERFADYSHILDENQFNEYEASDPFMEYFVTTLDSLLETFRKSLSANNYNNFFEFVADETAKQLEKTIFKCSFNRLGALLFDKQVRELTAYYSGHHFSGIGGFGVREKFSRLTQTASILNVDTVNEAKEFYQSSSTVAWRLSANDIKKILLMRQDFGQDEMKKLKL